MILFLLSGCLSNFKSNSSEPDEFDLHELIDPDSYAIEDRIDLNIGEVCANPCTLTVETSSTIHAVEYYAVI